MAAFHSWCNKMPIALACMRDAVMTPDSEIA